jgi:hypothetical protein
MAHMVPGNHCGDAPTRRDIHSWRIWGRKGNGQKSANQDRGRRVWATAVDAQRPPGRTCSPAEAMRPDLSPVAVIV